MNRENITQFIKFGIVGVSNTLISYIVYYIFLKLGAHYLVASIIAFITSVLNSYFWNNRYVFRKKEGERRIWWRTLIKTFISYAGTGLVLSNLLLILWIEVCGIPEELAPVINYMVTIPANFLINKFWAYRGRTKEDDTVPSGDNDR